MKFLYLLFCISILFCCNKKVPEPDNLSISNWTVFSSTNTILNGNFKGSGLTRSRKSYINVYTDEATSELTRVLSSINFVWQGSNTGGIGHLTNNVSLGQSDSLLFGISFKNAANSYYNYSTNSKIQSGLVTVTYSGQNIILNLDSVKIFLNGNYKGDSIVISGKFIQK